MPARSYVHLLFYIHNVVSVRYRKGNKHSRARVLARTAAQAANPPRSITYGRTSYKTSGTAPSARTGGSARPSHAMASAIQTQILEKTSKASHDGSDLGENFLSESGWFRLDYHSLVTRPF